MKNLMLLLLIVLLTSCGGSSSELDSEYDYLDKPVTVDTVEVEVEPKTTQQTSLVEKEEGKISIQIREEFKIPEEMRYPYYSHGLDNNDVKSDLVHRILIPSPDELRFEVFDPKISISFFNVLSLVQSWSQTMNKDGSKTLDSIFKSDVDDAEVKITMLITQTGTISWVKINNRYLFGQSPDFTKPATKREIYYVPRGSETIHEVKSGENLNLIARRYSVSVEHIIDINNLKTRTIYPGQKIRIK